MQCFQIHSLRNFNQSNREEFIKTLERIVARRGRLHKIYLNDTKRFTAKSKKMNNSKIISPEKKLDINKTYLKHHSGGGGGGGWGNSND